MNSQDLSQQQLVKMNAAADAGGDQFLSALRDLTAWQAAQYGRHLESHQDFARLLWSECATYGFEVWWAEILQGTEEEVKAMKDEGVDVDVPENFNPHVLLKDVSIWAPQDIAEQRLSGN